MYNKYVPSKREQVKTKKKTSKKLKKVLTTSQKYGIINEKEDKEKS